MKAIKGIFKYMGIVLVSLILIFALGIGLMYFSKTSIFGYYFVSVRKDLVAMDSITLPTATTINLDVKAKNYSLVIKSIYGDKIELYSNNNYVGFLKATETTEGNKMVISPSVVHDVDTNSDGSTQVTVNIDEPSGLMSVGRTCKVVIGIPYKLNNSIVKYNINATTHNGNISLENGTDEDGKFLAPITVNSLGLSTNKGDVALSGFGDTTGKTIKNLTLDRLNISTNGGKIDFSNFDNIEVKSKIVLDSKKATYNFKTLKSAYMESGTLKGGVEITGTTVKFTADCVECGSDGFIYKSDSGVLKIDKLFSGDITWTTRNETVENEKGEKSTVSVNAKAESVIPYENTIFTNSAVIELGHVIGKMGLYNEYGNVTINELSNQASMRTENGNITITKSGLLYCEDDLTPNYSDTSSLILYSTYGDISVGEYYQDAVIYSKKGDINVYSKYNTNKSTSRYYYSDISSKDGKINATTDKNPIKITASDNSKITLVVYDILKNNSMNPFGDAYMYSAVSNNGIVSVQVPFKSFKVKVIAKSIEGTIGATSSFGEEDVQINNAEADQPSFKIQGKKVILSTTV